MNRLNPRVARSRKKLGDALVSLSLEHGLENVSVVAVRKRANVGRATFYRHFKNLDELLADTLLTTMRELAELLRNQETIYDETFASFKFIHEHQDRFRLMTELPDNHPIRDVLKAEAAMIVIEFWEARGTSPVPMEVTVNHLVESTSAFISWYLNHINDHTPEQAADYYTDLILPSAEFKAVTRAVARPRTARKPNQRP